MYFDKIYQFCIEHNIKLVPIKAPSICTWNEQRSKIAKNYLESYQLLFLDMMTESNYVDIDWSRDTCDGGTHCNFLGGLKTSDYIGKWLVDDNIELLQHSDSLEWDTALSKYEQQREKLLLKMRSNDQKILDCFNWLAQNKDHCFIIFSGKNDISTFWNETLDINMRKLGMSSEYYNHKQESYIGIINRGTVTFEEMSPQSLIYKDTFEDSSAHSVSVKSANYKQGDISNILIDDIEYSPNIPGLNIVVYDLNQENVVYKANLDLTIPELTISEFYTLENSQSISRANDIKKHEDSIPFHPSSN